MQLTPFDLGKTLLWVVAVEYALASPFFLMKGDWKTGLLALGYALSGVMLVLKS
jgi:hypothetical protein